MLGKTKFSKAAIVCDTIIGVYILFPRDHLKAQWIWFLYVEGEWGGDGKSISRTYLPLCSVRDAVRSHGDSKEWENSQVKTLPGSS